jgi:hypothetical protein
VINCIIAVIYFLDFFRRGSVSYFDYSFNVCFPPFALTQKVEPKSQGCPDAPPGSPANAQQPRGACRIIHLVSSLSLPTPSSLHVSFLLLKYKASGGTIVRR